VAHFSCRRPQVVAGDNLGALTGQLGCRESAKGVDAGQLVNHLKGVSSRMLRKEFPELAARGAHLWTPSHFAASADGAPIERLREYVEAQEKPS
jgi:REP element-mobilizing transposase RayT